MEVLEKAVLNKTTIRSSEDTRGKPSGWQYIPIAGLFTAKLAERREEPTILDSSTIKPKYFIGAWAIHLSALILTISYLAHNVNNYFKN